MATSLLTLSMLLCHCGWLMLPSYCLFVVSEFWFIVVSLIAVTEKNKKNYDDAMIFNASHLSQRP